MDGFSNTLAPMKIGRKDGLDSAPNFVPEGEVDNLLMEPLPCPGLASSPPILNPSHFTADAQLCSGSHQLNQQLQSSHAHAHNLVSPSSTPYGGFHGTNVPRFRAQRGKATDPHSIAERHRRERISDRMKNLHDLIPNSNKTDKASMLDEIIDYIKFLQLEIKKPRSRLALASACDDASQEEDKITTAGAESGNKELSLMPIELAAAVSAEKGTHMAAVVPTEKMQIVDSAAISGAPFLGLPF